MYRSAAKAMSILLVSSAWFCSAALSHSGGTDGNGCHTNSKTSDYHCHKPKSDDSPASTSSSASPSSSSSAQSPGWPAGGVKLFSPLPAPEVPFDLKGTSGLSDDDFQSNQECKKFAFSEVIRQSDRGHLRLRCGKVVMYIDAK